MESRRAEDRNPAVGCLRACRLTAGTAVVAAAIILVVRACMFMFAVDPTLQASEEQLQWCKNLCCDLDPMLCAVSQDPRCSRCPAGWRWWRERCYFFSVGLWENLNWNGSAEFCRRHNSSLVVFEDPLEMEMDFLQCVMMTFPTFPFLWVGLTDAKQEGHWVWMDGSDLQRYMPLIVEWDTDHTDCADLRGERSLFAVSCDSYGPWVCKKES